MENDELGESRTLLRRTCGILGPCPLLREKPIIIIVIIIEVVVPRETSRASGTGKTMMSVLFDKFTAAASVFLANLDTGQFAERQFAEN